MELLLVLAGGAPQRGGDGLGPAFAREVEHRVAPEAVGIVIARQFQPEHAYELRGRSRVLFVDAAAAGPAPFTCRPLAPQRDRSFSSHSLSAAAVLAAFLLAYGAQSPPPAQLLAIRGRAFESGAPMSRQALRNLAAALRFFRDWSALAAEDHPAAAR